MDLVHALLTLRRRRSWVLIGILPAAFIAISTGYSIGPSGLKKKSLEYGAARTQLLVDSAASSLTTAGADVTGITARAQVFGQFFQTAPVQAAIARLMGVPAGSIAVQVPSTDPNVASLYTGQQAGQRNTGLLQESNAMQLLIVPQPDQPLITVYTQARNGQLAIRLADTAAVALEQYVAGLKAYQPTPLAIAAAARNGVPAPTRIGVSQLGAAQGGMVDSGASNKLVALAFLGLMVVDCFLVIVISGIVGRVKAAMAELQDTGDGSARVSPTMPGDAVAPGAAAPVHAHTAIEETPAAVPVFVAASVGTAERVGAETSVPSTAAGGWRLGGPLRLGRRNSSLSVPAGD